MPSNLERYKNDLESLIDRGKNLAVAMEIDCFPDKFEAILQKYGEEGRAKIRKGLPNFKRGYQAWYSEAKVLIKQLLPDRLEDFVRHYEKPKGRKDFSYENYRIDDYLQGLS